MERTDNGALEQSERTFNRVRVNVAANPFVRAVFHALVRRVVVTNTAIRLPLVGVDARGVRMRGLSNESVQRFPIRALASFQSDRSAALDSRKNHALVPHVDALPSAAPAFAADVRFV